MMLAFSPLASAEFLSNWTPTTPYGGGGVDGESCAISSGYIYCVGGQASSGPTDSVYYAPVSSSGVGTWQSTTAYGGGVVSFPSCAIYSGFIYCVGGIAGSSNTNGVYYAQISQARTTTTTTTTTVHKPVTRTATSTETLVQPPMTTTRTSTYYSTVTQPSTSTVTYTSTAVQPPPSSGSVLVYVYTSEGTPVGGTQVSLAGSSTQTADTNSGGEAQFSNLPLGATYTASATVDGTHLSAPVLLTTSDSQATVVLEPTTAGTSLLDYGLIGGVILVAVAVLLLLRRRP